MIAGFASSGVVVAKFGYSAAFALDAATFLVSATVLFLLPVRTRAATAADGSAGTSGAARWTARMLLGTAPLLMAMIAVRAVDGLGSSSHNVALPRYSSALDPDHPATFISQFWATWAIGNIVAQQVIGRVAKKTGRTPGERAFALGACAMSAGFTVLFSGLPTVPAVIAALVAGAADGFTEIVYVSRLQTAPDEQRARERRAPGDPLTAPGGRRLPRIRDRPVRGPAPVARRPGRSTRPRRGGHGRPGQTDRDGGQRLIHS